MHNIFQIPTVYAGVITDAKPLTSILSDILNFLLSIIGISGILGLVIAGVIYITAAGSEDRMRLAKNAAIGSVIGIAIALGSLILTGQLAAFFS
ncbi:MAG: hypothetical protein PHH40_04385 [Candidatus Moranbacteria bacterium]|nr:hypothetical protein [Candidatus Moranbacteria bacterium]MDD3964526.1 hypothetical protein [Candidatus Moranbacteria bacterium]